MSFVQDLELFGHCIVFENTVFEELVGGTELENCLD